MKKQFVVLFLIFIICCSPLFAGISDYWEKAKATFSSTIESVSESVSDKYEEVKEVADVKIDSLKESVTATYADVKDDVSAKYGDVKEAVAAKYGDVKDTVVDKYGDVKDVVAGKYSDVKDTVTEKIEESDISADSIKEKASDVATDVKDILNSVKLLASSKQIKTPSWAQGTWYSTITLQKIFISEDDIFVARIGFSGSVDDMVQEKLKSFSKPRINNLSFIGTYSLSITEKGKNQKSTIVEIEKKSDTSIRITIPEFSVDQTFTKI